MICHDLNQLFFNWMMCASTNQTQVPTPLSLSLKTHIIQTSSAQSMEEGNPFKKGAEVEVSGDEEGFRGSWYSATILKTVSKKTRKLYLQYHNLMSEDDETQQLRESVDSVLVRPKPPRETNRCFKLSEEVDAYHNDGWWEGVVTAVLENKRYSVFFRSSRELIEFHEVDLRLHREWVNGKWVPPLEESHS